MIIVLTGPTGVGKTEISVSLAKKLNAEIINADSTQVYKDLNIATAKIKKEEKRGIPHHLIDIKNIDEDYTVYDYQKDGRKKIDEILKKGKNVIVCGGTGLYINALLYDYKFEESNTQNKYEKIKTSDLYEELKKIDPETVIHKNNRNRIIRALNYYKQTNKPFSTKENNAKLIYDAKFIGLTTDRETLYKRINKRVYKMFDEGLLEEAKKIYNTNIRTKAVMTPIGYKELFLYFDKKLTLLEATELIKQRSRRYAKKQYTWFNNKMDLKWFNVNYENVEETIKQVLDYIEK